MRSLFGCLTLLLILAACQEPEKPSQAPLESARLSITASDAFIKDAAVNIYVYGTSELVASGVTDSNGILDIKEFRQQSGNYEIIVTGGSYVEEATSTVVQLQDQDYLNAVFQHKIGSNIDIAVTPMSTTAASLISCWLSKDDANQSIDEAITAAYSSLSGLVGFDIYSNVPANITIANSENTSLNESLEYGFYQAGRSQLVEHINQLNNANNHSLYTSIDFSMMMQEDIKSDCKLDGLSINEDGAAIRLSFGNVEIDSNTYRQLMGAAIIAVANSDVNKSIVTSEMLAITAQSIADSHSDLFDNDLAPIAIDLDGPLIYSPIKDNQVISGMFKWDVEINDASGILSQKIFVNDELIDTVIENGQFELDTLVYAQDSLNRLTITVKDIFENETVLNINFYVDNIGPLIIFEDQLTNNPEKIFTATVTDPFAGGLTVSVNGQQVDIVNDVISFTLPLVEGENNVTIQAIDENGDQSTTENIITLDTQGPEIAALYSTSTVVTENGGFVELPINTSNHKIHLDQNNLYLGTTAIDAQELNLRKIPYVKLSTTDSVELNYFINLQGVPEANIIEVDQQEFIVPLTQEFLKLAVVKSQQLSYLMIVEAKDLAGNVSSWDFNFTINISIPELQVNSNIVTSVLELRNYDQQKGNLLADCILSASGHCDITAPVETKIAALTIDNGYYIDPLDFELIEFNAPVVGINQFVNKPQTLLLYPFSNLATGLMLKYQTLGSDPVAAYNLAQQEFLTKYGFDIFNNRPNNDFTQINADQKHALLNIGLSNYLVRNADLNGEVNAYSWSSMFLNDSKDGVLDGYGLVNNEKTQLLNGEYNLSSSFYDRGLAIGIADYVRSEPQQANNQLIKDYLLSLYSVAPPKIELTVPEVISKQVSFDAVVTSEEEIIRSKTYLDDVEVNAIEFDTTTLADGQYQIVANATDILEQTSHKELNVIIDNTAPIVELTAQGEVNEVDGVLYTKSNDITINTQITDLTEFTFNQSEKITSTGSSNYPLESEGNNQFTVQVTDQAENTEQSTIDIVKDSIKPVVELTLDSDYYTNQPTASATLIASDDNLLNISGNIIESGSVDLVEGLQTFSTKVTDKAGNETTDTVAVHLDTKAPEVEVVFNPEDYLELEWADLIFGVLLKGRGEFVKVVGKDSVRGVLHIADDTPVKITGDLTKSGAFEFEVPFDPFGDRAGVLSFDVTDAASNSISMTDEFTRALHPELKISSSLNLVEYFDENDIDRKLYLTTTAKAPINVLALNRLVGGYVLMDNTISGDVQKSGESNIELPKIGLNEVSVTAVNQFGLSVTKTSEFLYDIEKPIVKISNSINDCPRLQCYIDLNVIDEYLAPSTNMEVVSGNVFDFRVPEPAISLWGRQDHDIGITDFSFYIELPDKCNVPDPDNPQLCARNATAKFKTADLAGNEITFTLDVIYGYQGVKIKLINE